MCTDGEGHEVTEDVGSVKRWKELKAAHRAERPSKVRKDTMKWSEKRASNRDERGLENGRESLGEGPDQQKTWGIGWEGPKLYLRLCGYWLP